MLIVKQLQVYQYLTNKILQYGVELFFLVCLSLWLGSHKTRERGFHNIATIAVNTKDYII